ncbi:hypothetical protein DE146DRAFT_2663 [Phaeosphaeria sp. MPI-PUGE-AT-0046c]|nr:hypothetical protein DE146DRAFT_2663 [Phaeosphaeria sp. MPI-PUGE-AT-0046c]
MGGKTFTDIDVPRMSPAVYQQVSSQVQVKLETFFAKVVVPRDAPGKADFGDIDYLVQGIQLRTTPSNDLWADIGDTLNAERYQRRGGSHSYAIAHPVVQGTYVQIDVELSPGDGTAAGAELFQWTRFMKGDSDLLQILGICHRSLGIICTDQGMHVRVEEIEPYNKKKALLLLTRDPTKAMEYYGLNTTKYWAGFDTENELFDWVTDGRFFSPSSFESRIEKSNDRSRQAKRPMYARFVEQYIPNHADKNASNTWTRQEVLQEALDRFDKQEEYDSMIEEHKFKETEEALWQKIRTVLPLEGNSLLIALKGLRRWVKFEDGEPYIASEPDLGDKPSWTKSMSPGSDESLLIWVKSRWEEAKVLEKARAAAAKTAAT